MSLDGRPGDRLEGPLPVTGNGVVLEDSNRPALAPMSSQRLRLIPNKDHNPDNYDDMELDFSPSIFTSLERFLPPSMLGMPRHDKVKFMTEILLKYLPHGERNRVSFIHFFVFKCVSFFLHSVVVHLVAENFVEKEAT